MDIIAPLIHHISNIALFFTIIMSSMVSWQMNQILSTPVSQIFISKLLSSILLRRLHQVTNSRKLRSLSSIASAWAGLDDPNNVKVVYAFPHIYWFEMRRREGDGS